MKANSGFASTTFSASGISREVTKIDDLLKTPKSRAGVDRNPFHVTAECPLSFVVALSSSLLKQIVSLNSILLDSITEVVHIAEAVLTRRITLFSRFAVPANGLCIVLRHSLASAIDEA